MFGNITTSYFFYKYNKLSLTMHSKITDWRALCSPNVTPLDTHYELSRTSSWKFLTLWATAVDDILLKDLFDKR